MVALFANTPTISKKKKPPLQALSPTVTVWVAPWHRLRDTKRKAREKILNRMTRGIAFMPWLSLLILLLIIRGTELHQCTHSAVREPIFIKTRISRELASIKPSAARECKRNSCQLSVVSCQLPVGIWSLNHWVIELFARFMIHEVRFTIFVPAKNF